MGSQIDLNHLGEGDELHFIDWMQGATMKHKAYRWNLGKLRFVKLDSDSTPTEKSIAPGSMKKRLTSVPGRVAIIRSPYLISAIPEPKHGLDDHVYHGLLPTPVWVAFKARSSPQQNLTLVKRDLSAVDLLLVNIGLEDCIERMTSPDVVKWILPDGTSWTFNHPESKVRWIDGIPYQPNVKDVDGSNVGWMCLSRRVRHKVVGLRSSNIKKSEGLPITIYWIGSYLCSSRKWVRDIAEAWRKRVHGAISIFDMSTIRVDRESLPRYFVDSILLHRSRFSSHESRRDKFDELWGVVYRTVEHYADVSHLSQSLDIFGEKPTREMMQCLWEICPLAFADIIRLLRQANLVPKNESFALQ
jgi:hypothetical protein